jgi:hypothetical protein
LTIIDGLGRPLVVIDVVVCWPWVNVAKQMAGFAAASGAFSVNKAL